MKKNSAVGGNYKFQHLKVFGSTENLYRNAKKYRKVFDEQECRYLYAELAFYNKLFDERDWSTTVRLVCTRTTDEKEICNLEKEIKISASQNVVHVREGWGTPDPGWWKKGKYNWEVFIEGDLVASQTFYIVDAGLVTEEENPYFDIKRIRLFESPKSGLAMDKRRYLKTFKQEGTCYINIEMTVDIKQENIPIELQFNFYNDAGQRKAYMEYFYLFPKKQSMTLDTGYGSEKGNYWFEDKYTLEVLFMDQLIAVVPFEVGEQDEEQPGKDMPFSTSIDRTGVSSSPGGEEEEPKPTFEEATADLKALIGLEEVKAQIDEFATYLQFLKIRKEKGFKENKRFNMHAVFTGNPGTGKTTVAKMLGRIYYSLDLLSNGKVHEVGRVDLVGEYIGQTAPKVKKAIEAAKGGILFVDEAYSLSDRGDDGKDFGKEVIEVLIKEMSDGDGDLAMIFAGYPKEMQAFIGKNPGMKSRIHNIIHFPDYVPQELMDIALYAADKRDVTITEDAQQFMRTKVVEAYRNRDEHFGNARFVHGIIEESKQNMALRLMREQEDIRQLDKEALSTISIKDVQKTFGSAAKEDVQIPVDEALLNEALNELHSLVGLGNVKKQIDELVKLVRYYNEIGRNVRKAFSLHTVFTGNPGTGKTTMARIIVKIYKSLGVLERGHLVECDRKSLVAGFSGQTAIKTGEMIDKAMGGGLFIDEAYSLVKGGHDEFGREAIDTILKRMEDRRGEFMIIAAGYPKEMQQFLESNPGLLSRFDRTINFPDYNAKELLEIADVMLEKEELVLNEMARKHLMFYIDRLLEHKHKYFGNARTIRKIVREVTRRQNLRLAHMSAAERTPDKISTVILKDVENFHLIEQQEERQGIGFKR